MERRGTVYLRTPLKWLTTSLSFKHNAASDRRPTYTNSAFPVVRINETLPIAKTKKPVPPSSGPIALPLGAKRRETVFENRSSRRGHQLLIVGQIVDGEKNRAQHLVSHE